MPERRMCSDACAGVHPPRVLLLALVVVAHVLVLLGVLRLSTDSEPPEQAPRVLQVSWVAAPQAAPAAVAPAPAVTKAAEPPRRPQPHQQPPVRPKRVAHRPPAPPLQARPASAAAPAPVAAAAPAVVTEAAPSAAAPAETALARATGAATANAAGMQGSAAASLPATTSPRFDAAYLSNPPPAYPSLSRRLGEEGRVVLRVRVTVEGRAEQVQLHTSSGFPRLDQAARAAVESWRFVPARRGSDAVAAWVLVPIAFNLRS